jgi:hypothetical protein
VTLELEMETLTDAQNLLASKDLTRPGPSVKLMRPTNDMSDSVARGILEKLWTAFQNG